MIEKTWQQKNLMVKKRLIDEIESLLMGNLLLEKDCYY